MTETLLRQELARLRPVVQLIAKLDEAEGLSPQALANLKYMAERALKVTRLPIEETSGIGSTKP